MKISKKEVRKIDPEDVDVNQKSNSIDREKAKKNTKTQHAIIGKVLKIKKAEKTKNRLVQYSESESE